MRRIRTGLRNPIERAGDRLGTAFSPATYFPGSGTFTAAENGVADIFLWGAGAGGRQGGNVQLGHGGGGAFLRKRVEVRQGQTIPISIGIGGAPSSTSTPQAGGDTTATLPNGTILRAGGGQGATSANTRGVGGTATGGDENVSGGQGGYDSATTYSYAGSSGGPADPSNAPVLPGRGGSSAIGNLAGAVPGGGGHRAVSDPTGFRGGDGLSILVFYAGATL